MAGRKSMLDRKQEEPSRPCSRNAMWKRPPAQPESGREPCCGGCKKRSSRRRIARRAVRHSAKPSHGSSRAPPPAATTLLKLLIDPNTPASVRVRAADSIFNHAAKAIEIEDI